MKKKQGKFWEIKSLHEMTPAEWESLCDRCARCCLYNFQDEKTGRIRHIAVACEFLDISTCRCSFYAIRKQVAPNCIELSPGNVGGLKNLPHTCTYRTLSEGKPLQKWHPLVSGNSETVHGTGISVRDRVVSGIHIHPEDLIDYDFGDC